MDSLVHGVAKSLTRLERLSLTIKTAYTCGQIMKSHLGGSDGKASALQRRRPGFNPWVGKISWRRKWQPPSVLLPRKSWTEKLAGYSPWGRKESDTTEQLHFLSLSTNEFWGDTNIQTIAEGISSSA